MKSHPSPAIAWLRGEFVYGVPQGTIRKRYSIGTSSRVYEDLAVPREKVGQLVKMWWFLGVGQKIRYKMVRPQ